MKKFAFLPTTSLRRAYNSWLEQYRKQHGMMDNLKIGFLVLILFVCGFIYLRYINLSSTEGYFLRKENQNLNAISFQYDILKTKTMEYQQKNREDMHETITKKQVIDIHAEVVSVPSMMELSYNK